MKKIYVVSSRLGGPISSHVYLRPPTKEQIEERRAETEYIHGKGKLLDEAGIRDELRKVGKNYDEATPEELEAVHASQLNWVIVEEIVLIEGSELDPFVPPKATPALAIGIRATGTVG